MAQDRYYLTTDALGPDHPRFGELMAVISLGSPQLGDEPTTVCDIAIVKDQAAANRWFKQQLITKPWVDRQ